MPQLDTTYYTSSVVWFLLFFGALFLFTQFWLVPRLNSVMEHRRQEISSKLKELSFLRDELAALDEKYRSEVASIQLEGKILSNQMLQSFNQEAEGVLNEINKSCETLLANEEKKMQERFEALLNDKDNIASALAEAFLSKSLIKTTDLSETC